MKVFKYRQNNSGGHFDVDPKTGSNVYVYVLERNSSNLTFIEDSVGIYFDGVNDGRDCDCCGDRWYTPEETTLKEMLTDFKFNKDEDSSMIYEGKVINGKKKILSHLKRFHPEELI